MQRLLALLAIPIFLVSACSGETKCPTGTEKKSGKCMLPDPSGEWDYELPRTPDLATADIADSKPADAADDAAAETDDAVEDTAEEDTAADALADVVDASKDVADLQDVADAIAIDATETVEIEQEN